MWKPLLTAAAVLLWTACAPAPPPPDSPDPWPPGRILDLTHSFDESTIYWPTAESFHLQVESRGVTEAGYYYEANSFSAAEHGGTHLDAPIHFARDRWRTDEIPLENLLGAGGVVDVSARALADRDYLITVDDLERWESEHGEIPAESILLFRTGYGRFWPDPVQYLGTDLKGDEGVAALRFPGLSPEAARWLVAGREIAAVGIDTPSIDYGQSKLFESHQVLFEANIPAFENVAVSEELPATGFYVVALPMKIRGGSGGPLRIIALVPE